MIEHETKTKDILSIDTCKIFFQPLDVEEPNLTQRIFLTVRFYQSPLPSLLSQNAPPKIILTLLSRCPIARERVKTQSGGRCAVKPRVSSIESKLRYSLGLTVISYLHKQKDPMKRKDLMYCRIWLLFSGSILCLTFPGSQKAVKT